MTKNKLTKQQTFRKRKKIEQHLSEIETNSGTTTRGLVISHYNETIDVESDSKTIIRCFQRRNLGAIVTGDYVIYSIDETKPQEGIIHAICPRSNLLERPQAHGKNKMVAANIDQVMIVIATEPEPIEHYIDRYLIATHAQNLKPILVLNKTDLGINDFTQTLCQRYKDLGYLVILTSAVKSDQLAALETVLQDKTSIFVGQSGVGKSALLNALFNESITKVGAISEINKRGKHTTTSAKLYHLPKGGHLIDSPGIREFGIWHLSEDNILSGFIEFRPFIGECKFRNCNHNTTTPGCAIIQAVNQQKISPERLKSYHRLIAELKEYQNGHY